MHEHELISDSRGGNSDSVKTPEGRGEDNGVFWYVKVDSIGLPYNKKVGACSDREV